MSRWITIEAERALYVERGRDVILCDRGHPGPVTLVLKVSDVRESAMTKDIVLLRAKQAKAVMPLIGPLLDAWEQIPNDIRCEIDDFAKHIKAIYQAMEPDARS